MEIFIGLIIAFAALIFVGHMKGAPNADSLSDKALMARINSENAWIEKYKLLPYENQQGVGIKKQFREKEIYVKELQIEGMKRIVLMSGKSLDETLIPIMLRSVELMKTGMSEEAANAQANNEFIEKRDASKTT